MFVLNKEEFGYMLAPLEKDNNLEDDKEQLINLKVEMMGELYFRFVLYFLFPYLVAVNLAL